VETPPFPGMATQAFHQRVSSMWIATAPVLTLRRLDAIWRFEFRNLF